MAVVYFVKYGKEYLHDPRYEEYILLDLTIENETNSCGYCDFTIYPDNPMYDKIRERDMDNLVEVYDDDTLLFAGYIYELGKEFKTDGHVKCKGELSYLNDSIVRPYSTETRGFGQKAPSTVSAYFEWLIEQHNNQVSENKRFKIGINTSAALANNTMLRITNDSYPTTLDEINNNLIGEDGVGGYIKVRHENGERYIDYVSELTDSNSQILDFGVNLTDYTQSDNSESIATFIIPTGAPMRNTLYEYNDGYFETKDINVDKTKEYFTKSEDGDGYDRCSNEMTEFEFIYVQTVDSWPVKNKQYYTYHVNSETDEGTYVKCPLNLASFDQGVAYYEYKRVTYYEYNEANDQSDNALTLVGLEAKQYINDYIKLDDMIYCDSAVKKYGWIGSTYENEDVTTRENLLYLGIAVLKSRISPRRTIEIKAIDMHFINPDIKPLRIGEYVRVRSKPHKLDSYFLCTSISLDLNAPENSTYTLGVTYDTLTGNQNKLIKKLNESINTAYDTANKLTEKEKENALKINETIKSTDQLKESVKKAVTEIYDEYAISDSPTLVPATGWSRETPEWTEGYYIWRRSITISGTGNTEIGNAVMITGNPGASATVVSNTVTYLLSNDGVNPPTGEMSETIPELVEGMYLWMKNTVKYSDGYCAETFTVSYIGEDAYILKISSSNGTTFKKSTDTTILTVSVFKGSEEIPIDDNGFCGIGYIRWYKGSDLETVLSTSRTYEVSMANISNKEVYTAKLEKIE